MDVHLRQELGGLPWRAEGPWLQQLPREDHLKLLEGQVLRRAKRNPHRRSEAIVRGGGGWGNDHSCYDRTCNDHLV